jgi:cytochrome c oxidase subunit 2
VFPTLDDVCKFRIDHYPASLLLASVLDPHSDQAETITHLTNYFFVAAAFIFLVVSTLTIVFLYRYRSKPGDKEPKPIYNNKKLEVFIVGIPLAMVAFFFYLTVRDMKKVLPDDDNKNPDVVITGHQWWWEAYYPASGVRTANEVHLPVGRKILIHLRSADVIHDWWVPQLGNKMDMIPGRENHLWLTIKDAGVYTGACSEFCGPQHAWMRIHVYADDEKDFSNWLAAHKMSAQTPQQPLARQGALLFQQKTCGGCHRVAGTAAVGTTGPELTHFASRKTILTGMMANNAENVNRFLTNPQDIKPGANMPNFWLDNKTRQALVAYLMQLK